MSVAAIAGSPFPGDDETRAPFIPRPEQVPGPELEGDRELDEHFAWLVREIDAGRVQPPPERVLEGPAISVSLGDACDVHPELLAAMCGPDGLGGQAVGAAFGQDEAADALRPSPVLAALTAQAVSRAVTSPGSLTDDELTGVLQAARRLANLAGYQQTVVVAEFARRRQAQFEAAKAAGRPVGCRDGEFPGEELAMELVDTLAYTGARIDTAIELTSRLPQTLARMADGLIDLDRARTIASRTRAMTDQDAAYADGVLAAAAPGLRPDQLAGKAARLEMKLAPAAVAARKQLARQLDQRVEARREESGNAALAGRELDAADVIASKAHIDAIAIQLRDSGLVDGSLGQLRALALIDLTQGRNPLDRIKAYPAPVPGPADTREAVASPPGGPDPVRLPALINLLVPAGTLLGWGTAPAQAGGWGLLDAGETRTLVQAAARHPRTRWCMTIIAPDGSAIAHGCAAGRHPWPPHGSPAHRSPPDPPGTNGSFGAAPPQQAARLLDLIRRLNVTLEPIATGTCDHALAEDRYVPGRRLRHLLQARNQTCTAPACNAQAVYCDLDHTVPYPDGPTDQCNLTPKCRRHHRTKQAPGWNATQPTPDTTTWTTPSGRTHPSTATVYDL
jgi:hypothetical protein